jgi:hypothetical protein
VRTRLARLLRKLRARRRSLRQQDRLLLRIGAAKNAFGFVKIHLPATGESVTRQTFPFNSTKPNSKTPNNAMDITFRAAI